MRPHDHARGWRTRSASSLSLCQLRRVGEVTAGDKCRDRDEVLAVGRHGVRRWFAGLSVIQELGEPLWEWIDVARPGSPPAIAGDGSEEVSRVNLSVPVRLDLRCRRQTDPPLCRFGQSICSRNAKPVRHESGLIRP
jgi:hypothetical protein